MPVDLDLCLGDADVCLDAIPDFTLLDVAQNASRMDITLLKRSLTKHSSGLYLLPRPVQLDDVDEITPDDLHRLVGLLKATLKGWLYAFAHEEEALDIVAHYMTDAKLPMNRVHQRWMFRRMRDVIQVDGYIAEGGILRQEIFDNVSKYLLDGRAIRNPIEYGTFYRGPFKR